MASFIYPEPGEGNFWNRYADLGNDIVGLDAWFEFSQRISFEENGAEAAWAWLDLIRKAGRAAKSLRPRRCPRVFVSHKQEDGALAFDVARCIHARGFDFWLDLIDLPKIPGPKGLTRAVLQAAVIEMGLINCTHLVAVMTKNTVPSRWVPYEYGRVKDDPPSRLTVAAFIEPPSLGNIPEYLYLAPRLSGYPALDTWLASEQIPYPPDCFAKRPWPFGNHRAP